MRLSATAFTVMPVEAAYFSFQYLAVGAMASYSGPENICTVMVTFLGAATPLTATASTSPRHSRIATILLLILSSFALHMHDQAYNALPVSF